MHKAAEFYSVPILFLIILTGDEKQFAIMKNDIFSLKIVIPIIPFPLLLILRLKNSRAIYPLSPQPTAPQDQAPFPFPFSQTPPT